MRLIEPVVALMVEPADHQGWAAPPPPPAPPAGQLPGYLKSEEWVAPRTATLLAALTMGDWHRLPSAPRPPITTPEAAVPVIGPAVFRWS